MKKSKKQTKLTMQSNIRTLSIKIYDEQMPVGWDAVKEAIRACDKEELHIISIKHDKDYKTDDWWEPANEKPHYHIIMRMCNNKTTRVRNVLNMLGIEFRHPEDDVLWGKHGVETVRDFAKMATYLTHETEQAQLDAKEPYDMEELISNLSIDEIKEVRQGYKRLGQTSRIGNKELEALDKQAWALGWSLQDFDTWFNELSFAVRANSKMRVLKQTYMQAIEARACQKGEINRLCVFIHSNANAGKTYNSSKALEAMGKKVYKVDGGGTGKYDRLKVSHDAVIIDDNCTENVLNMSDNYICQAYRRSSNNPFWCGRYFVVTSNFTFEEWLRRCGVEKIHFEATKSRFYICEVEQNEAGTYELKCKSASWRGTPQDQQERKEMFIEFRNQYNASSAEYKAEYATAVDYSDIIS